MYGKINMSVIATTKDRTITDINKVLKLTTIKNTILL